MNKVFVQFSQFPEYLRDWFIVIKATNKNQNKSSVKWISINLLLKMLHPRNAIPNPADSYLMRPINQRLPTNTTINSNSASLPSQSSTGFNDPAPAFRPASVINLSHSNDVVIGPMTQYQGSVTIYQYMDATVEASIGRMPNGNIGPGPGE